MLKALQDESNSEVAICSVVIIKEPFMLTKTIDLAKLKKRVTESMTRSTDPVSPPGWPPNQDRAESQYSGLPDLRLLVQVESSRAFTVGFVVDRRDGPEGFVQTQAALRIDFHDPSE